MAKVSDPAVAASGEWVDPDGTGVPAGEVHAWVPGRNQTLCGIPLSRAGFRRFSHVRWSDVQPETGRDADRVRWVCPRCHAGTGARQDQRAWTRTNPRP
ncbi:hypothetical protein [Cellulomonas fimi]|uniref:Uncharacterized protein n=1 Tax=Cellulomonas fimi TaxID=1708 RepID=A0A7Y0LWH7_CELFI|nr:hypothetical protein [Cellulomonas fimi]NMR19448.1 hypothetical protein [Cellulomonas fimi]